MQAKNYLKTQNEKDCKDKTFNTSQKVFLSLDQNCLKSMIKPNKFEEMQKALYWMSEKFRDDRITGKFQVAYKVLGDFSWLSRNDLEFDFGHVLQGLFKL